MIKGVLGYSVLLKMKCFTGLLGAWLMAQSGGNSSSNNKNKTKKTKKQFIIKLWLKNNSFVVMKKVVQHY